MERLKRMGAALLDGAAWERWTPAWGIFLWAGVWLVLALWSPWTWLAPWKTESRPVVTVQLTDDDPITVEGLVRTSRGDVVKTGHVDVLVRDVNAGRTVFLTTAEVGDNGFFRVVEKEVAPVDEASAVDASVAQQPVLEVSARYVAKGGGSAVGDVSSDPSATDRQGTESSSWVRLIIGFALVFLIAVLYLFVAPPTTKRVTAFFAFSYFVVLFSFLVPFALTYAVTQDELLVEQMKRSPVGLVEADDGDHRDWFIRLGGELRTVTAEPSPAPTDEQATDEATPPASPEPATAAAGTQAAPANELVGGVAVPIWVLVLAAFGASLAMAREVPRLQRDCPTWVMPDPRFPTIGSRIVGGLTLGIFGAEPPPPSEETGKCLGKARKRAIELYLNIVAAPFLAIVVYYLIRAVSGETLLPTFVVIAFATGLFSDVFVSKIKKFIASQGEQAEEDAAEPDQPPSAEQPSGDEHSDEDESLDGCEVDMTADPVADEELLRVVLGDSDEKVAEYAGLGDGDRGGP